MSYRSCPADGDRSSTERALREITWAQEHRRAHHEAQNVTYTTSLLKSSTRWRVPFEYDTTGFLHPEPRQAFRQAYLAREAS